jgi:hypothetical protein
MTTLAGINPGEIELLESHSIPESWSVEAPKSHQPSDRRKNSGEILTLDHKYKDREVSGLQKLRHFGDYWRLGKATKCKATKCKAAATRLRRPSDLEWMNVDHLFGG